MLGLQACAPQPETTGAGGTAEDLIPVAAPSTPTVGEVPAELLQAIISDLVGTEQLQPSEIEVVRAESAVWPDGALGCPQPGMSYTQAIVPGYWVVLRAGERQFDYRANERGYFQRCRKSFKRQSPVA